MVEMDLCIATLSKFIAMATASNVQNTLQDHAKIVRTAQYQSVHKVKLFPSMAIAKPVTMLIVPEQLLRKLRPSCSKTTKLTNRQPLQKTHPG